MITERAAKENFEKIINKPIQDLDSDFWEKILAPLSLEMTDIATSYS